jgi:chromosome segregation ATPase
MNDEEKKLLEAIGKKISGAPVLNGGFDRLANDINAIKVSQQKTEKAVEDIGKTLYAPKDGLFSKIQAVEYATSTLAEQYKTHLASDERVQNGISVTLENLNKGREQISKDISTIKGNLEEQVKDSTKLQKSVEDFQKEYEADMDSAKKKLELSEATSARLKDLAGKDLDQLSSIITLQSQFTKLFWAAAGLVLFAFGKFLWELFKR